MKIKSSIILLVLFYYQAVHSHEESECGKQVVIPENHCLSLYSKEETLEQSEKPSFALYCEKFCTSNSCKVKYVNIGSVSGASKNFYKVCICQ